MDKRKLEFMEKLDSIYRVVQQSSSTGISAVKITRKLGKRDSYRTTVHRYLNTLELMGKVRNEKGLWFPTDFKQKTIRDLPSEIKAELNLIKEDYINKKIELAFRRLSLLLTTEILNLKLPQDLAKELEKASLEFKERLDEISTSATPFGKYVSKMQWLKTVEIMIPKFLEIIRKICVKLEEGEINQMANSI